ncbi:MAG TPA: hypothetical protein PLO27_06445 [Marmoricola sp.]|nr:hypothetical protein [Marmoricola sp.]HNO39833.1 hypothetical protein [Marmoricola sp.]
MDKDLKRFAARWRHLGAPIRRPTLLRLPSPLAPRTDPIPHIDPVPLVVADRYATGRPRV